MKLSLWVQVVLLALVCIIVGIDKVNEAVDPHYEDTQAFLQLGIFIHENGGVAGFLPLVLSGRYTADVQHPLYPLVLSLVASREPIYFVRSKLVSLAGGVLLVVALALVARDLYGNSVGMLAAALLLLNGTFLRMATHVACETFLMLFVLLSLYGTFKGSEHGRYWVWAGVTAGLAYLTKGTGLLLLPSFLFLASLQRGWAVTKSPHFWLFGVMFLIVTSPLLIRNMVVYDTPIYEGASNVSLWLDSWWDVYSPRYGMIRQFPEVAWQFSDPVTMSSYLQSHSVGDVVRRLTLGMRGEFWLLVQSMDTILPGPSLGLVMLTLSGAGLATEGSKERVGYVLVLLAAFLIPFSWFYQPVPAIRYLAPLTPILCLYSARGIETVLTQLVISMKGSIARGYVCKWIPTGVLSGLTIIGGYGLMTQEISLAQAPVFWKKDEQTLSIWVAEKVRHQDVVLFNYDNPYCKHLWYVGLNGKLMLWKAGVKGFDRTSVSSLNELLRNRLAAARRYIVVHQGDVEALDGLAKHFHFDGANGLIEVLPVEGWSLTYADPDLPRRYLVYEATFPTTN